MRKTWALTVILSVLTAPSMAWAISADVMGLTIGMPYDKVMERIQALAEPQDIRQDTTTIREVGMSYPSEVTAKVGSPAERLTVHFTPPFYNNVASLIWRSITFKANPMRPPPKFLESELIRKYGQSFHYWRNGKNHHYIWLFENGFPVYDLNRIKRCALDFNIRRSFHSRIADEPRKFRFKTGCGLSIHAILEVEGGELRHFMTVIGDQSPILFIRGDSWRRIEAMKAERMGQDPNFRAFGL